MQTARVEEFSQLLRSRVSERTFNHSVLTAEYMASFAPQIGVTNEQSVTAGLLHDLCKGMEDTRLFEAAARYGIAVTDVQRARPGLLHGPVAAEECRQDLAIQDEAVYEAIYWHTTGRPGLGPVGLALYVADFAEPARKFGDAVTAREILQNDGLRAALRFVADRKLEHVRTKPHVDPATEAFSAWLKTVPD